MIIKEICPYCVYKYLFCAIQNDSNQPIKLHNPQVLTTVSNGRQQVSWLTLFLLIFIEKSTLEQLHDKKLLSKKKKEKKNQRQKAFLLLVIWPFILSLHSSLPYQKNNRNAMIVGNLRLLRLVANHSYIPYNTISASYNTLTPIHVSRISMYRYIDTYVGLWHLVLCWFHTRDNYILLPKIGC